MNGRAAVLRELEESGLSMADFCRRRGLVYGTVAAWRSEARRQRRGFVEVEIAGADEKASASAPRATGCGHSALYAELLLPGGAVLRVFGTGGAMQMGGQV